MLDRLASPHVKFCISRTGAVLYLSVCFPLGLCRFELSREGVPLLEAPRRMVLCLC